MDIDELKKKHAEWEDAWGRYCEYKYRPPPIFILIGVVIAIVIVSWLSS